MSLTFGLLGLLRYSDSTGYDLAKLFKETINSIWHAQHSQIHRELNRMQEQGWVSSQVVVQEGKPNKRVFSITDDGMKALEKWLHEPADLYQNRRSPLLINILLGAVSPEETLRKLKKERDDYVAALEPHIQKNKELIEGFKSSFKNGEEESLYWQMAVDFGIAEAKMVIQWTQECIDRLEKELSDTNSNLIHGVPTEPQTQGVWE
ncbi:MAG: PadR family transcriptional regulator [Defluviitaleaceae bacterium]|nr:PadR family transcriptional regulator [Defluviitaleaceae bacterium]